MDTEQHEVDALAARLTDFLLTRKIIEAGSATKPRSWVHGSGFLSALEPNQRCSSSDGVEIATDRVVHDPGANYEPPVCARCGTAVDTHEHIELMEPWLIGPEPTMSCQSCGWTALVGDWPADWAIAVGAPAVRFHNWPILAPEFVAELREVLGGRCKFVRAHY
jgi:hypothetical protein